MIVTGAFGIHRKHSYAGNSVSENFIGLSLKFMAKTSDFFFAIFHNYPFSTCHKKTNSALYQIFETRLLLERSERYILKTSSIDVGK